MVARECKGVNNNCQCGATGCPPVCDNVGFKTYANGRKLKKPERFDLKKRNPNIKRIRA